MASPFAGNISNSSKNNHVFIINIETYQNHGTVCFSRSGWEEFVKSDFGFKIANAYNSSTTRTSTIFEALSLSDRSAIYYAYDGTKYALNVLTITEINELLDYHERGNKDSSGNSNENLDKKLKEISGCLDGFVGFYGTADSEGNVPVILKLYFYPMGKSTRRNDRVVTQKDSPLITSTPKRNTGGEYGSRYTKENLSANLPKDSNSTTTDKFPELGVFVGASPQGSDDVKNAVTAPIRLFYNEALGMWDGSNQLLATLVEDLDAISTKTLDLDSETLLSAKSKDFYDKTSDSYVGGHSVGLAVPLSVQNNNPDMFGPNLIKCGTDNKIETIKVINRSSNSFKKGEIILCTLIGAEWVAQKYSIPSTIGSSTKVGRWGFYKFIANSDWFFRTSNYDQNPPTPGDTILPATCQQMLRHKFYISLANANGLLNSSVANKTTISSLNQVAPTPIYNLNYYIQTSSFDMSGPNKGGTADRDLYYNINMYNPAQEGGEKYFWNTPIYWGPVFPDGYQTAGYYIMKNNTTSILKAIEHRSATDTDPSRYTFSDVSLPFYAASYSQYFGANPTNPITPKVIADSTTDNNWYQLPADMAVNGKYSDTSFPLEATATFIGAINQNNGIPFATAINNALLNGVGLFLATTGITPPDPANIEKEFIYNVYGLQPVNPLKVQFSPLCAELAGADDIKSPDAKNPERDFQKLARDLLNDKNPNAPRITNTTKFFKGVYNRLNSIGLGSAVTLTATNCNAYNGAQGFALSGIPYDCYISFAPKNKPRASTTLFTDYENPDKTGANTVGIIASRVKVKKSKGGPLNVSATQRFGITGKPIGGTGQGNFDISALTGLISFMTGGGKTLEQKWFPAWGSTTNDSIDSFGTTCLYGMIWDYWPEKLTAFIPQYFTVLHFNDGILLSSPSKNDDNSDKIDFPNLDFRIPTDSSNNPLAVNQLIDSTTTLYDTNKWRVNTIRRGQLVTGDGFFYHKRVIGFSEVGATIKDKSAGTGFSVGAEIKISNGAVIKILSVDAQGGIASFTFAEDKTLKDAGFNLSHLLRGEGVTPATLGENGAEITIPNPDTSKTSAVIVFKKGIVYEQIKRDIGPQLRCPITKLSASSGEGKVPVDTVTNTVMEMADNTGIASPGKAGEYELFLFYQNDIGLVYHTNLLDNIPDFSQFITVELS
ncbi:MAG: hypothetical protein EBU90_05815 [Proteobacteria bacterium]|nr:hypothetical protein [Pseudomonadota bacterium]NBP13697.1 hypothetical protein [bacterium]